MEEQLNKHLEQDDKKEEGSGISGILGLAILFILFLPALIVSTLEYFILFRLLKWKPVMSGIVTAFLLLIASIIGTIFNPLKVVLNNTNSYIYSFSFFSIVLGIIAGYLFILWQDRQLRVYPELKVMKGWAENFEYSETPFEKAKKKKIIEACKNGNEMSYEAACMGVSEEPVALINEETYEGYHPVSRYYSEALKGTLVSGSTGSGKTITMLNLMYNDIMAGYPICVIDFKKGPDMAYLLSKWAKENGRQFYHFTSGSAENYKNPFCEFKASYDPLSTGTSSSKADMMLNLRKWDGASDVYKGRTQSILQSIFYLLETVDRDEINVIPWDEGGIAQFVAALKVENLFTLIEWLKNDIEKRDNVSSGERKRLAELLAFYNELTATTKSPLREQIEGLAIICRTLIMSSYSDWLAKGETPNHIDLAKLALSNDSPVILFQFNPNEEPEFARHMGSIILADLSRVSALKNAKGNETLFGLYIDEFQTLDPSTVAGILEKARSAKFFTTLSLQSFEQVSKSADKNGEEVLRALIDTVSNFIIHNGASYDSAERLSKIVGKTHITEYRVIGKRNSRIGFLNWKNSRESSVSKATIEEYRVLPSKFQELSAPMAGNNYKSTAYYITKECSEPDLSGKNQVIARKFMSVPNNDVLEPIPSEFRESLLSTGSTPRRRQTQNKLPNKASVDIPKEQSVFVQPAQQRRVPQPKPVITDSIDDDNFIIEEISGPENSLNDNSIELANQSILTQKEFSQKYKRESLEKPKKQTSFSQMNSKQSTKKMSERDKLKAMQQNKKPKSGLPEL